MTASAKRYLTEEEYLAHERASTIKHEFYQGVVYAMTGGKEPHNLIAGNAHASLHTQLRRRPCRVYQSDMRIKVFQTGLNTYPDVVVVCGQPQFTDAIHDCITNPIVIIEVLSASTERYDRGMKFQNYRTIDTLCDYLLIAQNDFHVEHFVRQQNNQWLLQEARGIEASLHIQSIECTLTLEDLFEKVDFEEDAQAIPRE